MRILFACHRLPFPPNRGGKIRPFNMIRHLARKHAVTVASLAHSNEELEQGTGLKEHCEEMIAEVLPSRVRWLQAGAALPTVRPSSLAYFYSRRLLSRVRERAAHTNFDVIMVHCAFAAQYVVDLPAGLRIMDYGDLDSGKWSDYSLQRGFPLSLGYRLECGKLRHYEKWLAGRFDRCTVTTTGELEEFKAIGLPTPCTVIPNGVDFSYFQAQASDPGNATLVFLGRMDYFPNVQGVVKFVREIFPVIRQRRPDARLSIVGSDPVRNVKELAAFDGVTVTGYVPDVRPYLKEAAVVVAPLYLARGTQNKILEAMSAGVPVVSTSQAAKGIRAVPGRDLLVGDSDEEFAAHVVRLLDDRDLRRRISKAARLQVETAHSWEHSMKLLDSILEGSTMPDHAVVSAG
jgi:sugar transferase (PEP-CTERM/EpsH1 system associated)